MSAKKLTNPAQGIKSFFTPKAENKKPQPDNVVCVDLVDSEPAKGKNTKVNKFFMSQVLFSITDLVIHARPLIIAFGKTGRKEGPRTARNSKAHP
jgi:hypothetical protein